MQIIRTQAEKDAKSAKYRPAKLALTKVQAEALARSYLRARSSTRSAGRGMSEYESLRKDIAGLGESVERAMDAQNRLTDAHGTEIERLWADNAELRDELHAVANRLESLTRAITTSPAEVAASIVNDANRSTLRLVRDDT